ncbi:hypothetical protein D9758_011758 [Tetrapyrgos nigripes]|uniref:MATE efflux family protein n=1 Tax=Tetrapyrgos nigripes TaxID=182062 RepID=A0A8H5CWK7_9AGAR|nr:hypothetical protein D9758_011758 [Tetrapyrgos nigripes]
MASYHKPAPSSIPSDYALLSRYAQHRQVEEEVIDSGDSGDETETETSLQRRRSRRSSRRSSHSNHQAQRHLSTLGLGIGSLVGDDIERVPAPRLTESTPLLNPDVPRIVENVDSEYTRDYPDGPVHNIPEDDDASSIGEPIYNETNTSTLAIFHSELRILTRYALPVYSTHLLEFSIVMASVLSIGHLSTTALAAISLGSMTANVTALSIIQGFISALDTMLPAAWTSRSPELVGLWSQRMAVVLAVALIPMLTVWWNAEVILLGLRQDPEVARLAGLYLRWMSLGLPAYAFNGVSRRYFQSQGLFTVPTRIIFIAAPVNAILNYILVWGPGKLAGIRLGFIGAPIATAIAFNLVSVLSLSYGVWIEKERERKYQLELANWEAEQQDEVGSETDNEQSPGQGVGSRRGGYGATSNDVERNASKKTQSQKQKCEKPKKKTAWYPLSFRSFTSLSQLVSLGLGGVGQTASEWWAWELVGLAAALLGPTILAAQSVLLVSASATFQAPFALGVGGSVRIGNLLGERHARRAKVAAYTCIVMGLGLSAIFSAMFVIFRNKWSYIFNDDPAVAKVVSQILPLVALFQVFDGNSAITAGILRARGKQILGALLNLSAYYVIGIPFGIWLAFRFDLGLAGLWIGLTVSLIYCSFFGTILCWRTDWEREVEKVKERLRGDMDGNGKGAGH